MTRRPRGAQPPEPGEPPRGGDGQNPLEPPVTEEAPVAASAVPSVAGAEGDVAHFPVVGVGASAGGLAAIEQLLNGMPPDVENRLALVVVQHLDPDRKSILSELVAQYTHMHVHEAAEGMAVQPGSAYIIPPNRDMSLVKGKLHLVEPGNPRGLRLPIDYFFRSLAQDLRERAVAAVLSGTGTDGTLGLKAVKEAGGLVMVQQPDTAQYDGMPRSAIATGLVDYVLPPEEMIGRLIDYEERAFEPVIKGQPKKREVAELPKEPIQKVFALLRTHTGHDFSRYKQNTILRRIERRIAVHQLESLDAYVRYLQATPGEVATLFRELLIGVTNFFRDPEAFAILEEKVVPALFEAKRPGETLRVWVPGCSTGEEAYSIAMLLHEYMTRTRFETNAQVFATDIDAEAIEQARAAVYPDSIAADVSSERLSRFFVQEGTAYRLKKVIRDRVVFATQNVAEDPPFSRMDLVSCRNLLIYMNSDLHRRVLPLFHYALNPHGYLFLGASETVGEFTDLFSTVDRKWKIFMRKPGGAARRTQVDFSAPVSPIEGQPKRLGRDARQEGRRDIRQVLEQALLAQHAPPAVVVNGEGEVLYIHGRTGHYLEPAQGDASLNLVRMAREGLRLELSTALRKAISSQDRVVHKNVSVQGEAGVQAINLMVRPLPEATPPGGLYLVVFEPAPPTRPAEHAGGAQDAGPGGDQDERIAGLERELRAKEDYLQTTVEELETSNEELTSTNEELQSANEELQSTNEELETSKEELQSVNEELMTVNAELQKKIEELSRLNNDLNNLLAATGIGTVFIDHALRIQRFTPAATEIINLIQTDIGRPVAHIVSNLAGYSDLIRDITAVLDTLIPKEREVQARSGRWYLMRIQPYRTLENVIEGAVLTFVDITTQKKMQEALSEAQRISVESMFDPVLVLTSGGKVTDTNHDALALFRYARGELIGMRVAELVQTESFPRLREALAEANGGTSREIELMARLKDGGAARVEVRLRRIDVGEDSAVFMVLHRAEAIENVKDSG